MGDAFGAFGRALVQLCIIINNFGILIVYLIIIGTSWHPFVASSFSRLPWY